MDRAIEQLEWAIRLLIDHNAPTPAITLAGAAEEILGKAALSEDAFSAIKKSLSSKGYGTTNEIGALMNDVRNYMKHVPNKQFSLTDQDLQTEAIQLITRALINIVRAKIQLPTEAWRFRSWVHQERPDLCNPNGALSASKR